MSLSKAGADAFPRRRGWSRTATTMRAASLVRRGCVDCDRQDHHLAVRDGRPAIRGESALAAAAGTSTVPPNPLPSRDAEHPTSSPAERRRMTRTRRRRADRASCTVISEQTARRLAAAADEEETAAVTIANSDGGAPAAPQRRCGGSRRATRTAAAGRRDPSAFPSVRASLVAAFLAATASFSDASAAVSAAALRHRGGGDHFGRAFAESPRDLELGGARDEGHQARRRREVDGAAAGGAGSSSAGMTADAFLSGPVATDRLAADAAEGLPLDPVLAAGGLGRFGTIDGEEGPYADILRGDSGTAGDAAAGGAEGSEGVGDGRSLRQSAKSVSGSASHELLTTFEGSNGSKGAMFDVTAASRQPLLIQSFDVHAKVEGACNVKVFTRPGTHIGYEKTDDGWSLLVQGTIRCMGLMKRTSIPPTLFRTPVALSAGETRAFYVSMETDALRYSAGYDLGKIYASNAHVMVHEGTGLGEFFAAPLYQPRVWNGVIHYALIDQNEVGGYDDPDDCVEGGGGTAGSKTLRTDLNDNLGSYGAMFNVRAKSDAGLLNVRGMSIYTDVASPVKYEIYTKPGKFWADDGMKSLAAWTLYAKGTVTGGGAGVVTPVPREHFDPTADASVPPRSARAFYVTFESDDLRYRNVTKDEGDMDVGDAFVTDGRLTIEAGVGVGSYPLTSETKFFGPRLWLGAVEYAVEEGAAAGGDDDDDEPCPGTEPPPPPPTPRPTLPPTFPSWECSTEAGLATTDEGGTGAHGAMFDVRALRDATVKTLEFKAEFARDGGAPPPRVTVYTKRGSYRGSERRPQDWTVVADVDLPRGPADTDFGGALIPPQAFTAVSIPREQIRSFYVTLTTQSPDLRYTAGTSAGRVFAKDSALEIMEGAGLSGYDPSFESAQMFESRVFNGVVHYEAESECDPPTFAPTFSPTPVPVFQTATDVAYSVMIAHPSDQEVGQMLAEVDWAVTGAVRGFVENDPDLREYGAAHGLRFGGTKSAVGLAAGQECATTDALDRCTPVDSVVTVSHLSSLESQAVTYALLKRSKDVADALSAKFRTTYVGDRTLEARAVITLRGVPEKRMGESETKYFERVSRDFFDRAIQFGGVDVLTVKVEKQELLLSHEGDGGPAVSDGVGDVNRAHRERHRLRGSRHKRHAQRKLQRKSASVGLTTTVTGSHRPPPDVDFAALVEDSIDRESKTLQRDLKAENNPEGGNSGGGGGGSDYFTDLEGVEAEVIVTIAPTASPTASPPVQAKSDGGMGTGATVGIIFAVGLLAIGAILACWYWAVIRKKKNKDEAGLNEEGLLKEREGPRSADPDLDEKEKEKEKGRAAALAKMGTSFRKSLSKVLSSKSCNSCGDQSKAEQDKVGEFMRLNGRGQGSGSLNGSGNLNGSRNFNGSGNLSGSGRDLRPRGASGDEASVRSSALRAQESSRSLSLDDLREDRDRQAQKDREDRLRRGLPPSMARSYGHGLSRPGAPGGGMRHAQSERLGGPRNGRRGGRGVRGGPMDPNHRGHMSVPEMPFVNSESEAEAEMGHDSAGSLGLGRGRMGRGMMRGMSSRRGVTMQESEQEYLERVRAKSQRDLGASSRRGSYGSSENLSRAGSVSQRGSQRSLMSKGHPSSDSLSQRGGGHQKINPRNLVRISEEEYEAKVRAKSQRNLGSRIESEREQARARRGSSSRPSPDVDSAKSSGSDLSSQMSKEEYMERVRMTTGRAVAGGVVPGGGVVHLKSEKSLSASSRGSGRSSGRSTSAPRPGGLSRGQSVRSVPAAPSENSGPRGRVRRMSYEDSMLRNISPREGTSPPFPKSSFDERADPLPPRVGRGGDRRRARSVASSRKSSHADCEMSAASTSRDDDDDESVEEMSQYRDRMARMMGSQDFTNRYSGCKPPRRQSSKQSSKRSVVTATTVNSSRISSSRGGSRRNLTSSDESGLGPVATRRNNKLAQQRRGRGPQDEEFNTSGSSGSSGGMHNSTPAFGYDEEEYPVYRRSSGSSAAYNSRGHQRRGSGTDNYGRMSRTHLQEGMEA